MINLANLKQDKDGFLYAAQIMLDGAISEYPDIRAAYKYVQRCKTSSNITINQWIHIASHGRAMRISEIKTKIYKVTEHNPQMRASKVQKTTREVAIEMPILGYLPNNKCYRLISNKNVFRRMQRRKNDFLVWIVDMPNWMTRAKLFKGML